MTTHDIIALLPNIQCRYSLVYCSTYNIIPVGTSYTYTLTHVCVYTHTHIVPHYDLILLLLSDLDNARVIIEAVLLIDIITPILNSP